MLSKTTNYALIYKDATDMINKTEPQSHEPNLSDILYWNYSKRLSELSNVIENLYGKIYDIVYDVLPATSETKNQLVLSRANKEVFNKAVSETFTYLANDLNKYDLLEQYKYALDQDIIFFEDTKQLFYRKNSVFMDSIIYGSRKIDEDVMNYLFTLGYNIDLNLSRKQELVSLLKQPFSYKENTSQKDLVLSIATLISENVNSLFSDDAKLKELLSKIEKIMPKLSMNNIKAMNFSRRINRVVQARQNDGDQPGNI